MKILKTINSSNLYRDDEMNRIIGGMGSNINEATDCGCSGSSNSTSSCNNNLNSSSSCSCSGNNNNINKFAGCKCS